MKKVYESQHPVHVVPSPITEPNTGDDSFDTVTYDEQSRLVLEQPATPPEHVVCRLPNEQVQSYILNEVKLKLDHGHSISVTEDHLQNTETLLGGCQIPTKWCEVLKLMKSLGYRDPKHFKVCVSQDHSCLLENRKVHPSCPKCSRPWAHCIDYYCLGLNLRDWFLTAEQCQKLMSHWNERGDWLNQGQCDTQTELWHGERFRELSWFWNPEEEYTLPELCPHCRTIVPASIIQENATSTGSPVCLKCTKCTREIRFYQRTVRGDPRNQAIIIHEDGWCSFSTSTSNSIAAITITHACMSKADRSDANHARVYSFVPVSQLPRDAPHKFDAFFEPLIREIEELFIEGEQVFFKEGVPGVSTEDDYPTLRLIPLLTTADSKAHHEIGLTSAGGLKGCRRCTVSGDYVPERRHYYYGHFQFRFWNPYPPRTAQEDRQSGREADCATTVTERKRLSKESGVTGESIFYRLYDLCGFDPVKDLVIDAMHAIVLNLIRTELEAHLLADLGANADRNPLERDPKIGGLLDRRSLAKALDNVDWLTELKDGRVPSVPNSCETKKLGHWKAEEFSKFIQVAPVVLRGLIPRKAYTCFCCLSEIHNLVFSKRLRIEGWNKDHFTYFQQLLWSHAILYEELYGINACTENVEYSLHMPEDVKRHSTMDNYWCYLYERQVKYYKQQTSNMKSLCKTFADRAYQLQFVTTFLSTHPGPAIEATHNLLEISKPPVFLSASSVDAAITLKEFLASKTSLSADVKYCLSNGIMLGKCSYRLLTEQELNDIRHWLRNVEIDHELPKTCQTYARVQKHNDYDMYIVYRTGEFVIVNDAEHEGTEWLVHLTDIVVYGPIYNKFYYFLNGTYFAARTHRGAVEYDTWTGQPKMVKRDYRRLCLTPLHFLDRKVMLYPDSERQSSWITIDPDCPVHCEQIKIPYFPKPGEVVKTRNSCGFSHLLVTSIQDQETVQGHQLRPVKGSTRWTASNELKTVLLHNVLDLVPHHTIARCIYLE